MGVEGAGGDFHEVRIILEVGEAVGPGVEEVVKEFVEEGVVVFEAAEAGEEGKAAELVTDVVDGEVFAVGEFFVSLEEGLGAGPVLILEFGLGAVDEGGGDGFMAVEFDADLDVAGVALPGGFGVALEASDFAEVIEAARFEGAEAGVAAFVEKVLEGLGGVFFALQADVDEEFELAPFEGDEAVVELVDVGPGLFD